MRQGLHGIVLSRATACVPCQGKCKLEIYVACLRVYHAMPRSDGCITDSTTFIQPLLPRLECAPCYCA